MQFLMLWKTFKEILRFLAFGWACSVAWNIDDLKDLSAALCAFSG